MLALARTLAAWTLVVDAINQAVSPATMRLQVSKALERRCVVLTGAVILFPMVFGSKLSADRDITLGDYGKLFLCFIPLSRGTLCAGRWNVSWRLNRDFLLWQRAIEGLPPELQVKNWCGPDKQRVARTLSRGLI